MSFASQVFWFFSLLVFATYLKTPDRHKWILMLVASYAFYGYWDWRYIPLLFLSTAVDYYCVHRMAAHATKAGRRPWLLATLIVNLGTLFFFKYWNFAGTNLDALFGLHVEVHALLLPLGISFYTFQTLSYSLDAYNGRLKPERHFGYFCVFVSFFPQLVAGPIERSQTLIPQLKALGVATREQFRLGVCLIVWGLFLKLVVADNLSDTINGIYFSDTDHAFTLYWLAGILVSLKIYCDFMAYSEIARGLASLFGVKLTINFRRPFLAADLHDFWQRWHVSLTRWIGVYMQLPLSRRYPKEPGRSLTTVATMTAIGLWHGASWNFVLFGLYHGILLALWTPVGNVLKEGVRAPDWLGALFSRLLLGVVIVTGSTMFYIADFDLMTRSLLALFDLSSLADTGGHVAGLAATPFQFPLAKALVGVLLLTAFSLAAEYARYDVPTAVVATRSLNRWAVLGSVLLLTLVLGNFDVEDFIYFEF